MVIYHHSDDGDAQAVTYRKTYCHLPIPAGVGKKPILDLRLVFHPIPAGRRVVDHAYYPGSALIHVTYFAMLVHVHLANMQDLYKAASAARDLCRAGASIQTMNPDGVAVRIAEILCHVECTPVDDHAMKGFAVLVKYIQTAVAIAEERKGRYRAANARRRSQAKQSPKRPFWMHGLGCLIAVTIARGFLTVENIDAASVVILKSFKRLTVRGLQMLSLIAHVAKPCSKMYHQHEGRTVKMLYLTVPNSVQNY